MSGVPEVVPGASVQYYIGDNAQSQSRIEQESSEEVSSIRSPGFFDQGDYLTAPPTAEAGVVRDETILWEAQLRDALMAPPPGQPAT